MDKLTFFTHLTMAKYDVTVPTLTFSHLGGALTSAKTTLSSIRAWISGMVQDIEIEMKKHSDNKTQNRKTIDIASSNMVITDKERKGEQVKTIGDVIGKEESLDDGQEVTEDDT